MFDNYRDICIFLKKITISHISATGIGLGTVLVIIAVLMLLGLCIGNGISRGDLKTRVNGNVLKKVFLVENNNSGFVEKWKVWIDIVQTTTLRKLKSM